MSKKIMSTRFDLGTSSMFRVLHHYTLSRFVPMGVYRGGPGLKCILVLIATIVVGRPLYYLSLRFERPTAFLRYLKNKFHL